MSNRDGYGSESKQLGKEWKPCAECGDPVNTVSGMDNFVKVTHYGTTEYADRYYCDEVCLEKKFTAETPISGDRDV